MPSTKWKSLEDLLDVIWDSSVNFDNFVQRPDVNSIGIFGEAPIATAIHWGDIEAVQMLIDSGADISIKMDRGNTPLHDAINLGHFEIARLLLKNGAPRDITNDEGKLPRDCCWKEEHYGIFGESST